MRRYTDSHEWAEKREKHYRIGISHYAREQLGEIVYVELPQVGAKVEAGQEAVVLESTKAASDVYSPLSGAITAINTAVKDNPALLNISPEEGGWLFELEASEEEWETLLTDDAYTEMVSPSCS